MDAKDKFRFVNGLLKTIMHQMIWFVNTYFSSRDYPLIDRAYKSNDPKVQKAFIAWEIGKREWEKNLKVRNE